LLQIILVGVILRSDGSGIRNLLERLRDPNPNPQVAVSMMIVSAYLLWNLPENWQKLFARDIFLEMVGWVNHFNHVVRTVVQQLIGLRRWAFLLITDTAGANCGSNGGVQCIGGGRNCSENSVGNGPRAAIAAKIPGTESRLCQSSPITNKDRRQFRLDNRHHSTRSLTLSHLSSNFFVFFFAELLSEKGNTDAFDAAKKIVKNFQFVIQEKNSREERSEQSESGPSDQELNLQKRITPWEALFEISPGAPNAMPEISRGNLIVIASLLDNVPNIAGLCRTGEIFGVETLVIPNKKILSEVNFQKMSVSAEKHLPILEVKENQLLTYLSKLRKSGYTIVAVEQTSNSHSLTTFRFPVKTALLLGSEQQGIPPAYLQVTHFSLHQFYRQKKFRERLKLKNFSFFLDFVRLQRWLM
jgi:tRNA G18 (ribose-2'-O)-methylase SpoU